MIRLHWPAVLWWASSITSSWNSSAGSWHSRRASVPTEATCTGAARFIARPAAIKPWRTPRAARARLACSSSSTRCTSTAMRLPRLGRLLGDVGEDDRLAAAGGQHKQHRAVAGLKGGAEALDGILLVGAQCWGHGQQRSRHRLALASARSTVGRPAPSP